MSLARFNRELSPGFPWIVRVPAATFLFEASGRGDYHHLSRKYLEISPTEKTPILSYSKPESNQRNQKES